MMDVWKRLLARWAGGALGGGWGVVLAAVVGVLVPAPEAAAQIVNVQALFDEATAPMGFSGTADLSLDWRTGSTNLIATRLLASAQLRTPPHTVLVVARGEYNFARDELLVSRFLEHVRYRYRLLPWLAAEAFAQHELDAFRRLRARALVGAGPRFTLFSQDEASLVFGVALMGEYEQLRRDGEVDAGQERLDPRLSSYMLGRVKLAQNMSLVETMYVQPRLTSVRDLRILNETLLVVTPNARFTFSMGFIAAYDAEPPATVSRLDTQLRTSLGVKF